MSPTRPAKFRTRNASTHHCWSASHSPRLAMQSSQFRGLCSELDGLGQHRVVPVPLHEISAAHEGSVFCRAAVVVPEVEVHEVDRLREWWRSEHAILSELADQLRCGLHP